MSSSRVISELIGARIRNSTLRLGEALGRWGLTPNLLTAIGLVLNLVVAAVIASGSLRAGGALLLLASGFDMLDGAVARASGTVTKFGGFLDSTIDRYSESLVYGGVLVYLLGTRDYRIGSLLIYRRHGRFAPHQLCAGACRGGRLQGLGRSPGAA